MVGLAADQFTKYLVVSRLTLEETIPVLGDVLQFHFVKNPGAAFSMASGSTWIFSILASAVVIGIVVFARKIRSRAWAIVIGMLLGGVLGNLTDRLFREPSFGLGHVIDFIYTPWMMPAIYNVADILICCSMVLFLILTFMGINMDGTRTPSKREQQKLDAEATESAEAEPAPEAELTPTSTPETNSGPDAKP